MERVVYDRMAELDQVHWWYRARREILSDLIARRIAPPKDARILEVGCGTGHNLEMLNRFGRVEGIEVDPAARQLASMRLGQPIMDAPLPALPGVPNRAYDMIAILDVIEHIDEDVAGMRALAGKLKPGAKMLITVPAFPWMWSAHDVVNHHKRRYTKSTLRALVDEAGLKLEMMSWFNSLLFPLAATARLAGRMTGHEASGDKLPLAPVNKTFEWIFRLERYALGRLPLPPGVSLVAIASAP
ncbi:class I SAM-dependent methyltransferase [Sphingosinicella sp.]|uniref:class I SAM-dependent methyltransferase n=1 Tax=Sphingosinicella sp. TaxID=1917971 RepID=UPI004038229E